MQTKLEGQKAGHQLPGTYRIRDGLQSGMRNLLLVMEMVCILIVLILSWVYITVKTQ